jgi:hypothetical protein
MLLEETAKSTAKATYFHTSSDRHIPGAKPNDTNAILRIIPNAELEA